MLEAKTIKRCASACLFFVVLYQAFLPFQCSAQTVEQVQKVMFYNCENLFDPTDDPDKQDDDYTPAGSHHWTSYRLYEKLLNLSKVVVAAGEGTPPMLIGLAEVENDSVVQRLIGGTPLRRWEYQYVMTHSDDVRGINVALLYQPMDFRLLGYKPVKISMPQGSKPTRDLLHVWGRIVNADTLDIIVCHLPSRLGGTIKSNANRVAAYMALGHLVDCVNHCRLNPHVIVMGDMNDTPQSRLMRKSLDWDTSLHNLMQPLQNALLRGKISFGSHKYKGKWRFIDQFWVNTSMAKTINPDNQHNCSVWVEGADVVHESFMMVEDETHLGHRPLRSFYGFRYEAGFSDHLPITLNLHISY